MITFKPEWAKHMDGAKFVSQRVPVLIDQLYNDDLVEAPDSVGGIVDLALALACREAKDTADAVGPLSYVIEQLGRARAAMLSETE